MAQVMAQTEMKWAIPGYPSPDGEMGESVGGRLHHSPEELRRGTFKSQRSFTDDDLVPVMDHVTLATTDDAPDGIVEHQESTAPHCESAMNLSPVLTAEAQDLMDGNFEADRASQQTEETEPTFPGHSVKHLIDKFESGVRPHECLDPNIEEDVLVSLPSIAEKQESGFPLSQLIPKTALKVKRATNTVIEGVKGGFTEFKHQVKGLTHKFHLPQSSLEENPFNNIHVPHPDKFIGGMVGLGMNIQKVERGHHIRVIPGGLAHLSKLRDNDVIISVNDNDVRSWEFEELQQFFGGLEVEIHLVIERESEDESEDETDGESGEVYYTKVATNITLFVEGDKVIVDIDIKYGTYKLKFSKESEPVYIFQNQSDSNTKFLTIKDNNFCVAQTSDLTLCLFKLYIYKPNYKIPRVIFNISQNRPLDLSKTSRIGVNNKDLRGGGLNITNDKRFFYNMLQRNTDKYTFELASQKNQYLVVDADGKLTTQHFKDIDQVTPNGLFDIVRESIMDKQFNSSSQKTDKKFHNGKGK